jgi:hypothetical protein
MASDKSFVDFIVDQLGNAGQMEKTLALTSLRRSVPIRNSFATLSH